MIAISFQILNLPVILSSTPRKLSPFVQFLDDFRWSLAKSLGQQIVQKDTNSS